MPPTSSVPPAVANVLGVGIAAIDMATAIHLTDGLLQRRGKGYVCLTGVHGIMEARRDEVLRRILNQSFLSLPDGMPTVWVGRLQGHQTMKRIYGPDFMWELCKLSVRRGYRHFLCGGKPGVAQILRQRLELQFPSIQIVGAHTPPFRNLAGHEEDCLVELINRARPDIIWVGISTPKQERFMATILDRLDVCLLVGVGAAFDIHAGLIKDAPEWIKPLGLQWLCRLIGEPRRLGARYLRNNPRFLWEISLQLLGLRSFGIQPP